ncbi:MAG TPA: hypothetical protein DEV81_24460 [Cyanobacteria bacterium UBA11049]|nr:hypothetical protein [Cyanobacteria bacterium UBA11049]
MSYSSLIQVMPEAWRSSTGLAALASVGIHLVLLAVLPYVPFDSQDHILQQTIGVVALTPEEQSRLPQIDPIATIPSTAANGQSDLPPLPAPGQGFQSDILPPLPPPTPSFLPPPPPINAPSYQYPISNSLPPAQIPTVPVPLPPPPQNPSIISQSPFGQPPPPEPNQNIRTQQLTPLPPNAIPPNQSLPPTSGLQSSEAFSPPPPNSLSSSQGQNTTQTQNQVAINNRSNQQTLPRTPSRLPERTKQELIARRDAIRRQRLASNRTVNSDSERNQRLAAALQRRQQQSSSAATNTPTSDTQRLAAALQRRQQQSSSAATNTPTSDTQRLAAALQRRQQNPSYTPSPSTSNRLSTATRQTIAQIDAFKQQQQKVRQDFPTAALQAPIRYKIKTCNKQLDGGVAILAAVVSPQGKIISGPDLVSNNSSVAIRRAAKKFIKNYQFPKTTNTVNQPFRLDFSYDFGNCPVTTQPRRSQS